MASAKRPSRTRKRSAHVATAARSNRARLILLGAFRWDPTLAAFAATGVVLSATYMLWMFQRVNYGPVTN